MQPCKRIEIVIEQRLAQRTADLLLAAGAPGYTQFARASGYGDRGFRRADEPTGTSTNSVFIVACDSQAQADAIVTAIRPMLSHSGGICLVSDAQWVIHQPGTD